MAYQTLLAIYQIYTYILNIYDLVWLGFMSYQPPWGIKCQILFIHTVTANLLDSQNGTLLFARATTGQTGT